MGDPWEMKPTMDNQRVKIQTGLTLLFTQKYDSIHHTLLWKWNLSFHHHTSIPSYSLSQNKYLQTFHFHCECTQINIREGTKRMTVKLCKLLPIFPSNGHCQKTYKLQMWNFHKEQRFARHFYWHMTACNIFRKKKP